jgi:UDP-GlcNAc:undecaprenyl-phosphate GlcNAc-1-phosphate transferase
MRALLLAPIVSGLLALVFTPVVRALARRHAVFDPPRPAALAAPVRQVPRLGGLAVALAFFLTLAGLWLLGSVLTRATLGAGTPVLLILAGSLPILAIGALDDLYGLRALPKLSVEIAVSIGLFAFGLRIDTVALFSLPPGPVADAVSCVLTIGWLIGIMNATNLIDGLDGLASGVVLFALAATAVAALLRGEHVLSLLVLSLSGAVLGFLVFNLRPASIFLGDAGSLFLGYLLAATAIWSVRKAATTVLVVCPVVALGLPILDTSLTISRRLLGGLPMMQGDRDHVHHRLDRRLGTLRAILILYAVCAAFSALALAMLLCGPLLSRVALVCALGLALSLGFALGYLRFDHLGRSSRKPAATAPPIPPAQH